MRNYLDWLDDPEGGFYVREVWSADKSRMVGSGRLQLMPIQRRILGHCLVLDEDEKLPYETVLYSDIKKSGKTTISASVGAWFAEESKAGVEIYVIANSQDQANGRVMRDLQYHFEKKNALYKKLYNKRFCRISEYRIDFPNGTFIQTLSNSYSSIAGSRQSLTLWDELWGAKSEFDRRVWDEMVPISTVSTSLRFIGTYAGFENESDLLWDLYLKGIGPGEGSEHEDKGLGQKIPGLEDLPCWKNGRLFTYWNHEPRMPWQTEEYMDAQREGERPAAYLRLHENRWVTTHEEFIPVAWYERAAKVYQGDAILWKDHPFLSWPITIGIDAGIKRDSTALVGVAYDSKRGKVGEVFHKIWKPTPDRPVDLEETVENELIKLNKSFNIVSVIYDPAHLMTIMARLRREGFPAKEFVQSIPNMTMASQLLFDLFKNNNLELFYDDEAKRQIQMAVAETTSRGFRIVKSKTGGRNKIDYAIALAMACYDCVSNGGVDISIPVRIRNPYLENQLEPEQLALPFELRDNVEENDYYQQNY